MRRHRHSSLLQSAVERRPHFGDGKRSIHFLPVDEQGRSRGYAHAFGFVHRSLNRRFILRLDAGLQFALVEVMFLPLLECQAVEGGELGIESFF